MNQSKQLFIEGKIKEILARYTEENPIELSASLAKDLGLSSFDYAEILFDLEDEFEIEIPEDGIIEAGTVGEVVKYLAELTQG